MKLLMMTRMFTALIDSVKTKEWQPKGIPAIYRLIEGLNKRNVPTDVVLLCKRKRESEYLKSTEVFRFNNLNNVTFYAVPFKEIGIINCVKINNIINQIYQFFYCLALVVKNKYPLIYSDRANIVAAAFFSFFMRKKVALRLLGVKPDQLELIDSYKKLRFPFTYLSYLANFSYIIGSEDGSDVEYFLSHINKYKVPYEILLNGVEDVKSSKVTKIELIKKHGFIEDYPIILLIGKMEKAKGCKQFVESLIKLDTLNNKFYAILIGDGPLLEPLRTMIIKNNLEKRVKFLGVIEHSLVYNYYQMSHIYVSPNLNGNLSNTVLESIRMGKCLVTLDKSIKERIDISTEKIIPDNCALRVNRNNIVEHLVYKLNDLLNNPLKIRTISDNMKKLSQKLLKTWDERINHEIDLLIKLGEANISHH